FLAHDLKHDRPVALKVLLPELAASMGADRFQREIRFAARLQHPHILTVLDSGATAGQLWFTMPYVEGESLRSRLTREGQLALKDALRIAREAAQALHYAHQHQIVHRDIKPENILLTSDGSTLVADFGIARALDAADAGQHLTQTGMTVGTPQYMSPEQAAGGRAVDERSDIYSLGCVLYEMLVGEPPFTGTSAAVILMRRISEPVPSLRKLRSNVPEAVENATQRALAQVPGDRFATAAAFAEALETVVITPPATPTVGVPLITGPTSAAQAPAAPTVTASAPRRRLPTAAMMLGLGFLVGLGVLFAWRRNHSGIDAEDAGARRVAVLPFENLGDSSAAYFADGMTDEVRGKLSKLPGLAVIARASSNEYRRTTKPPQQIARELGADYLLTATVRWEKRADGTSRVRVSPELVRVAPGAAPTTTWQEAFDAALTDVFQVQGDIAGKVASAMNVALGATQKESLTEKPTANLAAYDAFLKGEAASQGIGTTDPATIRRAIGFYEQAVALDSTFLQAWVQLARSDAYYYYVGTANPAMAEAARQAAERVTALAPERPE
ncbi:MAG: serine/threonine-protein kinase, partial [Gemmatimonadales bacterium]